MSDKSGMSKVILGLYVGNYRDSKDAGQLASNGITHIIAIHDTAKPLFPNKEYLLITASDDPATNLTQYFQECNDFIHRARLQGGKVLIHCLAGMSRSVTVAVAYIMSVTNLGCHQAIRAVRGARPFANPNEGFQRQLLDFECLRLPGERRRLLEKFRHAGIGNIRADDESQCIHLALLHKKLLDNCDTCVGHCTPPSRCPTGLCRAKSRLFRRKVSASKISKVVPLRREGVSGKVKTGARNSAITSKSIITKDSLTDETTSKTTNVNLVAAHSHKNQIDEKLSIDIATVAINMKRRYSEPYLGLSKPNVKRTVSLPLLSSNLRLCDEKIGNPQSFGSPLVGIHSDDSAVETFHINTIKICRRISFSRFPHHLSSFSLGNITRLSRSLRGLLSVEK